MLKRLLLNIVLLLNVGFILAQNVTFNANAPAGVIKGEEFRLAYTLKNGQGSNAQFPNEIKGLDILIGPSISQSHRTQIINGKASSESSISYVFIVVGNNEGMFTIPSAKINVDGKTYTSNSLTIKVLPPDKNSQQSQQGSSGQGTASAPSKSSNGSVADDDAFVRPIVSKTKVNEQEAFLVTFRFYTFYDVKEIGKIEFPEFEGFMVEDIDIPGNVPMSLEHYNGRNYHTADLKKSLLFPQRAGKITIPSGKLEMLFSVPSGRKVQTLFGPQEIRADVNKVMRTKPITIDVTPLPTANKPVNFANAVGTFTLNSSISETKTIANEAVTIKLTISGTGNLKLVKNPEIKFPKDFETYDPKTTNNFNVTGNGLSGTKTIEYLFIPRHQGNYTIPPIEFSYFDINSKSYKTLRTPEYKLEVDKDPNSNTNSGVSYTNQSEVQKIQDIRFLKTGEFNYKKENSFIMGSFGYILWYIIPAILFIICFIVYRKQIEQNANIVLMKTKRANKLANKRLKAANVYLNALNKEKFYEETLRATWGYLSDKLVIPVADLNRENIEYELIRYGVSKDLSSIFISILDTCEYARYAPGESDDAMDKLYQKTVDAISKMEGSIKKKNNLSRV